jgi:hypothetical protein
MPGARTVGFSGLLVLVACTSVNKATFAIEPQTQIHGDEMLRGVEESFQGLGFELKQKTDFLYPETRKETTYFLSHRVRLAFQSTDQLAVLRLEHSGTLYVDWIEITDLRREINPGSFADLHAKIASDINTRLGVDVIFQFVPPSSHQGR